MNRAARLEANAKIEEIDTQFHAQLEEINVHEYRQVSAVCKEGHPDEVRDLLVKAIRQDAARERRQAHSDWMEDVRPWVRKIVGANV